MDAGLRETCRSRNGLERQLGIEPRAVEVGHQPPCQLAGERLLLRCLAECLKRPLRLLVDAEVDEERRRLPEGPAEAWLLYPGRRISARSAAGPWKRPPAWDRGSALQPIFRAGEVHQTSVARDGHLIDGRQKLIQGHGRDDGVGRRAVAQAAMLVTSSVASPITRVRRIRGRRVGWWCAGVGVDKAGVGLRPAWWYLAKNIAQGAGAIRILCAQCVVRGAGIVVRALVTA